MQSRSLTTFEVYTLRRIILAALPSDHPEKEEALFVLPPEDVPPLVGQGETFGPGSPGF
jgi:hypothetical protein